MDKNGNYIETEAKAVQFGDLRNTQMDIYPNPTKGIINIKLSDVLAKEAKVITVFNTMGVIIKKLKLPSNTNKNLSLNLENYPKVMYFIQLKSLSVNSSYRVIVE